VGGILPEFGSTFAVLPTGHRQALKIKALARTDNPKGPQTGPLVRLRVHYSRPFMRLEIGILVIKTGS
jgi:hypothetical protein